MRSVAIYWRERVVGTIQLPDSFRPPITQAELSSLPASMLVRSRSWLFDVRPGDVRLELRKSEFGEEVVAIASDRLGPGDIGLIVGFEPEPDCTDFLPSPATCQILDQLMHKHGYRQL